MLSALEAFLSRHTSAQELGLRLHGEQLAAGVRFVRMVRGGHVRPGGGQSAVPGHVARCATRSTSQSSTRWRKADLFAAFLLRGLELVRAERRVVRC